MENEKMDQLEKAAQGIVGFMKENCSPHDTVIVTSEQIKLVSDSIGIPIKQEETCDDYAKRMESIAEEIILGLREKQLSFHEVGSVLHQVWAILREEPISDIDKNQSVTPLGAVAMRVIDVMKKENLTHNQVGSVLVEIEALLGKNKA